jgi:transporter family-2 protein
MASSGIFEVAAFALSQHPTNRDKSPCILLGVVFMVCLAVVLRDPIPSANTIGRVPGWAWSGGIFGAIFIALSIITIPKLGGAAYIALLVTGQMVAALAFDHFGWLGIPQRSIDLPRLLGVALLVGGVVLIRR